MPVGPIDGDVMSAEVRCFSLREERDLLSRDKHNRRKKRNDRGILRLCHAIFNNLHALRVNCGNIKKCGYTHPLLRQMWVLENHANYGFNYPPPQTTKKINSQAA